MLAARAEGIGSTLTGFLTSFANEVMDILGAPKDDGWYARSRGDGLSAWGIGARKPAPRGRARNSWQGDLGFTVPEPLWPK